jgi:hypothetical protein
MEDGGRLEKKRHCAVNSKQKSTKNLFLVNSFLILPKSTPINQCLEDMASRKGR